MTTTTFDPLAYFEKLKEAGVPEPQARVQAEGMRAQSEAIHAAIKNYDESRKRELVTKGDLQDTRLKLEKEIQEVRLEVEKVRADLTVEIKTMENRLLKWQIGIAVTILVVMAKGFNWLGF